MDKYFVTIISYKDDKFDEWQSEPIDSMINVTRLLLTFKAKKGYEVVNIIIDKFKTLV